MTFSNYDTSELIEYLPEALFLEDFDGNILDVNSQACELLGYSKGELLNQDVDKLVPEGNPVFLPDQIDEATRSGKPIETINIRKDGTEVPIELRGRIIEDDGKERILVSIRDISERREAQQKQHVVAEGASQAIYLFQDEEFKFVNKSFEEITGYTREELQEIDIFEFVHPEYREQIRGWTQRALAGDDSELPEKIEYRVQTRADGYIWVRSHPSLIEYKGKPAIVGNAADITEEKELKDNLTQYKMAVEETEDLMAAIDRNYRYLFANQAYKNLYKA